MSHSVEAVFHGTYVCLEMICHLHGISCLSFVSYVTLTFDLYVSKWHHELHLTLIPNFK